MAIATIRRVVMRCDGCGSTLGDFPSATEARAAAYSQGWRFPARVDRRGQPMVSSSDACPECLPAWTAQPSNNRGWGGSKV